MLEKLDDYQDVEGFQIRPPRGYSRNDYPTGLRQVVWGGEQRADKTKPQLSCYFPPLSSKDANEDLATLALGWSPVSNPQNSELEGSKPAWGLINGLAFVRVDWKGTTHAVDWQNRPISSKERGAVFALKDGTSLVVLDIRDSMSEEDGQVEMMIAAAMTFRKK
jgi:hypothetical protein